jgi:hypothetical protein
MPEFKNKVRIDAVALSETDKALCCDVGAEKPCWIPKSQIDDDSEVWKPGHTGDLILNQWFALKEGLI